MRTARVECLPSEPARLFLKTIMIIKLRVMKTKKENPITG